MRRCSCCYALATSHLPCCWTSTEKLLRLNGIPFDGGLPIVDEGKIIGGIGVSCVRSDQDAIVGKAGLAAWKQE